jgi:Ca2+-binding RTX toxin-like protein
MATINGGTGNDTLTSGSEADQVNGGDGADLIAAGGGDTVDGGAGEDTLVAQDVVSIAFDPDDPTSGTLTFFDDSSLFFSNIEQFLLNSGPDGVVQGSDGDDLIDGGFVDHHGDRVDAGDALLPGHGPNDDEIYAGIGDDTIVSGAGNDTAYGGMGNDELRLGEGNEYAQGDEGNDTVLGEGGDDFIRGDAGNDLVYGGEGHDQVFGGADNDFVYGGTGNDQVFGGLGEDEVYGGDGDDTVTGMLGNDVAYGGDGDDRVLGNGGNDTLYGGAGSDVLLGEDDADTIYGEAGDTVYGGDGGDDNDTLIVSDVASVFYDPMATENGVVTFNDGGTLNFYGIENVVADAAPSAAPDGIVDGTAGADAIGPGFVDADGDAVDNNDAILPGEAAQDDIIRAGDGADTVNGGLGNNDLYGEAGDDVLTAGAGDDLLDGGTGADTLTGGGGADTLRGGDDADVIHGAGGAVVDGGEGGTDQDTLVANDVLSIQIDPDNAEAGTITFIDNSTLVYSNIETLVLNGTPDGVVQGTDNDDLIDDTFVDRHGDRVDAGDAILPGHAPNDDEIYAGLGNDTVVSGAGNDTAYGGQGDDRLTLGEGNDYAQGDEGRDTIHGEGGDDFIRGDAGNDLVYGGEGNDQVFGGADNDLVYGGAGNDQVFGGLGEDEVYGGDGDDTVTGMLGNDVAYGGDGDDNVLGNGGNDTLYGGAGADVLQGEDDADTIHGEAGDTVYGGEGGDDNDTLILTDVAQVVYDPFALENGVVTFNDGGTLNFYGIEHVVVDGEELSPPDGLVEGTEGDDLIDSAYTGDPEGDRIDNSDGFLPGMLPEDDWVFAGGGNDTVHAGTGRDKVYGGEGKDQLFGGSEGDTLYGEAGDDTLSGDWGDDTLYGGDGNDSLIGGGDRDHIYAGAGDVVDGGEDGDDYDTLNLSGQGLYEVTFDPDNSENGTVNFLDADGNVTGSLSFTNIENIVPCFTPGSLILTERGDCPVEELEVGDRVLTRDNGYQVIRWTGRRDLSPMELQAQPRMRPVRIRAGALGDALPERDMLVSPQHRMLMTGPRAEMFFGEHEVLVAATHMVGMPGVTAADVAEVSYIHLLFDRHEIIRADGAWTESFQPGVQTLNGVGAEQRAEILALFPELATPRGLSGFASARMALKRHEAAILLR